MNRRFLTVLGLSAVLALVVSGLFYQVTSSARRPRRAVIETKSVVVATNPVPLGGVVKPTDLKIAPWPAQNIPPGSFDKIDDVVDRVAVGLILPEEPVLAGRLAPRGSGVGLSPIIPPGMRAVPVRVNEVIGVAGFVLPGSKVDVLVTGVPRTTASQYGPVTKTVLSNLQVISAGSNIQPDAKGQPVHVPVVTLLVTPEQGELLTLASSEGRIQLALRNNIDDKNAPSAGFRAADLFGGAGKAPAAPAPRVVRVQTPVKLQPPRPPPPPPPQIELIRGDKKSTELVQTVYR